MISYRTKTTIRQPKKYLNIYEVSWGPEWVTRNPHFHKKITWGPEWVSKEKLSLSQQGQLGLAPVEQSDHYSSGVSLCLSVCEVYPYLLVWSFCIFVCGILLSGVSVCLSKLRTHKKCIWATIYNLSWAAKVRSKTLRKNSNAPAQTV